MKKKLSKSIHACILNMIKAKLESSRKYDGGNTAELVIGSEPGKVMFLWQIFYKTLKEG